MFFQPLHRGKTAALLLGVLFLISVCLLPSEASTGIDEQEQQDQVNARLQEGEPGSLNFFSPEYQAGVTYVETCELWQTTKVNVAGQELDQVMQMNVTDEMSLKELPEGGKEVTIVYTHVAMDMNSMGMNMHYDSMEKDSEKNNPLLAMLGDLVGQPMTLLVDDDYNVVEMDVSPHVVEKLQANDATKELASPKQFEQTTRLARTLPSIGVATGDTWDFDLNLQDLIRFTGTGTLVGLNRDCKDHGHHLCAEIHMEGSMDMDFDQVGDKLGGENNEIASMVKDVKVKDGHMDTTLLWDNNAKFARTTEMKTTMTMQMENPIDKSLMEIPIEQVIKTTVDMME